jgi:flagellar biosynthesis protein FlhB
MLCWTLGQLLLTSAAIYGATISRTTLRAILGTFAIVIAASGAFALAIHFATSVIRPRLSGHRFPPVQIQSDQHLWEALVSLLIAGGLCVLLCLLLWFAWSNFRRYANSAGNIIVQLVVIISSVWLISLGLAMAIFILESG